MAFTELLIGWADQSAAFHYDENHLSPDDARRALTLRSDKAMRDWKVSRALLRDMHTSPFFGDMTSLSHSGGHAVCAMAPHGWKLGIDLEAVKPRDIDALAQWVCSADERDMLTQAQGDTRLHRFYQLWTLKEAFIKAAGLSFPADMASVGLAPTAAGVSLRSPAGLWNACSYRAGPNWMVGVVWQEPAGSTVSPAEPRWIGAVGCALPKVQLQGRWSSDSN